MQEDLAGWVRAHVPAGERILIWGLAPGVSALADRAPATRYPFHKILMTEAPLSLLIPGLEARRAELLARIERERPAVIIVARNDRNGFEPETSLESLMHWAPLMRLVKANYELAVGGRHGADPDKIVGGNLELYGRTVWATRTGLAFGGGLGILLPTASFDPNSTSGSIARSAATLRPWDVSFFTDGVFVIRPFVDVRDVIGPFVIHFRQGLDIVNEVGDISSRRVVAISGLYIGYRVAPRLSAGIEAFEVYTIDAPIDDRLRATLFERDPCPLQRPENLRRHAHRDARPQDLEEEQQHRDHDPGDADVAQQFSHQYPGHGYSLAQ